MNLERNEKKRYRPSPSQEIGPMAPWRVFISYSYADYSHPTVIRLFHDLEQLAFIRIVKHEFPPGTLLLKELRRSIKWAHYFLFIISKSSVGREWPSQELHIAYADQLEKQKAKIIPIRIDDTQPPPILVTTYCIDLAKNYDTGFHELRNYLHAPKGSPLARFLIDSIYDHTTVVQVSGRVNEALIQYFLKHPADLKRLDRLLFEELVAELFAGFGYEVELTKQTRDGGPRYNCSTQERNQREVPHRMQTT